ncbi:hypothetical protein HPG02_00415 [Pediococcus pentosaceus]|nr:hypothetical protein [Pediococcus pentosaceus]MBU7002100.1 hypothetical protein [Pediococcus pentosaceus]
MTLTKKVTALIEDDKKYTAYRISKETGVNQSTITGLRTGKKKINNITLETAEKLGKYWEDSKKMKLIDFYQIEDLQSQKAAMEESIISLIQDDINQAKKFVENDFVAEPGSAYEGFDPEWDDVEQVKELAKENVTDVDEAIEIERFYFDGQDFINGELDDLEKINEELEDLTDQAEKIIKIVEDIEDKGFDIVHVVHSTKSLSTYLTLNKSDYERFMEEYDGIAEDDEFVESDDEIFGVRIANHPSGEFWAEGSMKNIAYKNNYINIDYDNFF